LGLSQLTAAVLAWNPPLGRGVQLLAVWHRRCPTATPASCTKSVSPAKGIAMSPVAHRPAHPAPDQRGTGLSGKPGRTLTLPLTLFGGGRTALIHPQAGTDHGRCATQRSRDLLQQLLADDKHTPHQPRPWRDWRPTLPNWRTCARVVLPAGRQRGLRYGARMDVPCV